MPKGYFISAHRSTADPEKRAAYLKLAGPAIEKYNGKILASTNKIKVFGFALWRSRPSNPS